MTPDQYANGGRMSDPQSWNLYAYTAGDPANRTDPSGADFCGEDDLFCGWDFGSTFPGFIILPNLPGPCWTGPNQTAFVPNPGCVAFISGIVAFLQAAQSPSACLDQTTSPRGTWYLCIHQSGNDWNQLLKDLGSLSKKLTKDQDCLKLLMSKGASSSTIIGDLGDPSTNFSIATFILSPTNGVLAGTTNDVLSATPIILARFLFLSGSQYQADLTILHELAHLLKVFGPENQPGNPSSAANDQTIVADCSKTLGKP